MNAAQSRILRIQTVCVSSSVDSYAGQTCLVLYCVIRADEMESNDTGIDPYGDMDNDRIADLSAYSDDDLPVYAPSSGGAERSDLPLGDSGSFIE